MGLGFELLHQNHTMIGPGRSVNEQNVSQLVSILSYSNFHIAMEITGLSWLKRRMEGKSSAEIGKNNP